MKCDYPACANERETGELYCITHNRKYTAFPVRESSDPNTFEALIELWREPSGTLEVKLCADELAALAPHYVSKDKVKALRDAMKHTTVEGERCSEHSAAHEPLSCSRCKLTALLEQP